MLRLPEAANQVGHLDCGHGCIESLVPALDAGAVDCLFHSIGSEHAEAHRNTRVCRRLRQTPRCFASYIVEMRSVAANHGAQCDDGVEPLGPRQLSSHHRHFPRARHFDDLDILFRTPGASERIQRAAEEPVSNKAVEPRHDDGESKLFGRKISLDDFTRHIYFPANAGLRFSRNAFVPSRRSSVAAVSPNAVASKRSPCSRPQSRPTSTASMASETALGPLASTL